MSTTCGKPETGVSGSETGARSVMLAVLRARAGRAGIGLGWRKGGGVQGYGYGEGVARLTASHFASIMGCWMPGAFSSQEGSSGSTWLVEHSASPLTLSTVMKCGDGLWSLTCHEIRHGWVRVSC